MTQDLDTLRGQLIAAIESAASLDALEAVRVEALGKQGSVTTLLKTLGKMSPDERQVEGPRINGLREAVATGIATRKEALERAAQGRTTIAVAHRLSTVSGAGEILVLDHGTIVERGRHASLRRRGGLYAELARAQGVLVLGTIGVERHAHHQGHRLPLGHQLGDAGETCVALGRDGLQGLGLARETVARGHAHALEAVVEGQVVQDRRRHVHAAHACPASPIRKLRSTPSRDKALS